MNVKKTWLEQDGFDLVELYPAPQGLVFWVRHGGRNVAAFDELDDATAFWERLHDEDLSTNLEERA